MADNIVLVSGVQQNDSVIYIQISTLFHFFSLFFVLVASCSMWDLSSPTRDPTHGSAMGVWSLNHWATREVTRIL